MKHILLTISLIFGATTDAAMIKVIDKAWLFTEIWVEQYDPVLKLETGVIHVARAYKTYEYCLKDLENRFMGLKDIDGIKIVTNETKYKQLRLGTFDGERVYKLECHSIAVFE